MSTSFVSLQCQNDRWGVVVKTFPIISDPVSNEPLTLPMGPPSILANYKVKSVAVGQTCYIDQETAEVAAKALAKLAGFEFVPYQTNITVFGPFTQNNFVPYELKLDGTPGVVIEGRPETFPLVVKQVKKFAEKRNLTLLYPNGYDVNQGIISHCGDRNNNRWVKALEDSPEPLFSIIDLPGFLNNPSGPSLGFNILDLLREAGIPMPIEVQSPEWKQLLGAISKSILKVADLKEKMALAQKWKEVGEALHAKYPTHISKILYTHLEKLKDGLISLHDFDNILEEFVVDKPFLFEEHPEVHHQERNFSFESMREAFDNRRKEIEDMRNNFPQFNPMRRGFERVEFKRINVEEIIAQHRKDLEAHLKQMDADFEIRESLSMHEALNNPNTIWQNTLRKINQSLYENTSLFGADYLALIKKWDTFIKAAIEKNCSPSKLVAAFESLNLLTANRAFFTKLDKLAEMFEIDDKKELPDEVAAEKWELAIRKIGLAIKNNVSDEQTADLAKRWYAFVAAIEEMKPDPSLLLAAFETFDLMEFGPHFSVEKLESLLYELETAALERKQQNDAWTLTMGNISKAIIKNIPNLKEKLALAQKWTAFVDAATKKLHAWQLQQAFEIIEVDTSFSDKLDQIAARLKIN